MSKINKDNLSCCCFPTIAVFEKMANITIFSLNIVENSVNILEKVL